MWSLLRRGELDRTGEGEGEGEGEEEREEEEVEGGMPSGGEVELDFKSDIPNLNKT